MVEFISILALISLYKFLDTPSDTTVASEDIYMDETEYR
jgi:hypothetical protein